MKSGPASPAGRIDDFAVLESNSTIFYVATASGGLWKTVNQGTTFSTVFDNEPTSSIGDVAIAPTDANLVWVGTGENNNGQSSSWSDGVYKSFDGGKSWKNRDSANPNISPASSLILWIVMSSVISRDSLQRSATAEVCRKQLGRK